MTKSFTGIYCKVKALCLIVLGLLVVMTAFYGCTEKKEGAKEGAPVATYTCELMDKLPADMGTPIEVNYGSKVKLLGVTTVKLSQAQIKVSYYWQLLSDNGEYDQVFVHFLGTDNQILFQGDHSFCQKRPFAELKDKVIKETQLVAVPQSALGKAVNMKVGIYSLTDKSPRLKIESASGAETVDENTSAIVGKLNL